MSDVPLIKQFLQMQAEMMAYLMAISRDLDAAEEIFQNAAVVVIQRTEADDPIRNFRAWAKEVVRRQALHYLREHGNQQKRVRPVVPELMEQISLAFAEDDSSQHALQRELIALEECIQQVTGPARTMLAMRYEQRATFQEISAAVDRTASAVQRALSRLRKSLHACVRDKLCLAEEGAA